MPTIITKDALRQSVEAATGGQCTVLYDSQGFANYMRIIPKFRCEDISANLGTGVHPAFIVGGVEKNEIFLGQYNAVNMNGLGVSQPSMAPYVSINFDNSKLACTNKGTGWHMMTNWEWAAVALWCIKNGYPLVRGNTYYGQSHASPFETGRRVDGGQPGNTVGANPAILNGSSPASWRHSGDFTGISGLVGNVWEWQDGMKLVDGVIKIPSDNNYTLAEASWPDSLARIASAVAGTANAATGALVLTETAVADVNRGPSLNQAAWSSTVTTGLVTTSVQLAMKRALLAPYDTAANMGNVAGYIYANNTNAPSFEAMPVRGGRWDSPSHAGLAALNLSTQRSHVTGGIGFRPAFIG
jgi:hypothetical protein